MYLPHPRYQPFSLSTSNITAPIGNSSITSRPSGTSGTFSILPRDSFRPSFLLLLLPFLPFLLPLWCSWGSRHWVAYPHRPYIPGYYGEDGPGTGPLAR
ncbi:hypothetical protein BDZ91DRAFT_725210 [Kalaharituber pfeilii]|nr:hypothetical protein BDZ91DRAFT_725210 [Kalaharituber pfeilii]